MCVRLILTVLKVYKDAFVQINVNTRLKSFRSISRSMFRGRQYVWSYRLFSQNSGKLLQFFSHFVAEIMLEQQKLQHCRAQLQS